MDANRISNLFSNLYKVGFVVEKTSKQKATRVKTRSHQRNSFWALRVLIIFFKVIGLATFTHCVAGQRRKDSQTSSTFQYSELGIAYNVVLVSLMLASVCLSIPYTIGLDYQNKTSMTVGIEIFQTVIGSISISVVLLTYCFGKKKLVRIGNRLTDVEHELNHLYRLYAPLQRQRVFRVLTLACTVHGGMTVIILIAESLAFHMNPIAWLTDILPTFHLGCFMIQYFLLVTVIQVNFADVNRAIQRLTEANKPNIQPQSFYQDRRRVVVVGNSTVHQLQELRDVHDHLCDVSQDVSDFYSVSILFAIFFIFFSLVYNGYYLIAPLLLKDDILEYFVLADTVLWLIFLTYPVLLLTNSITKLLNEVGPRRRPGRPSPGNEDDQIFLQMARTGKVINNLMSCVIDKEAQFEVKQTRDPFGHGNRVLTILL
ncbi:PREDICTED: uncharacterized protein LOC106746458 [Dinoponera quadriceps]|uniref:Gustatory receptor n=1 Tax=Dinoponera quadriceps TaxID=609295 RepID=A0A6P3XKQ2_DINQU|nr:PREDICTED: uncharacterized protein LOC106746458 [Dinoponera quadriceps]